MEDGESLKKIISHSKEYGFVIPSSEIYEGLNAVYDYAHNGVLLKNNIREYWWKSMVQMNQDIIGVDSAIFTHPKTWIASGHVEAFNDPLIDNKDSKKRYRADVLIEDYIEKQNNKLNKEVLKAKKKFKISITDCINILQCNVKKPFSMYTTDLSDHYPLFGEFIFRTDTSIRKKQTKKKKHK